MSRPDAPTGPTGSARSTGSAGTVGSTGPSGGLRNGLLASAALIALVTAVARVVGFGRWLVFSETVGATCVGTAYSTANQLPNVLFEVVAGGALAAVVIPLLAGPIARKAAGGAGSPGEVPEVDRIVSALLTWALLVLLPVALVLAALAGPITDALLPDDGRCAGQQALSMRLLLVFAPQVVLYGLGVVLSGVLQAHRRFFAPAIVPLVSSLVVIGGYVAYSYTSHGATAAQGLPGAAEAWLGWGTTAAVAAMTLPLLIPVRRLGVRLRFSTGFPPGVARRGLVLAAAGIGALLSQQVSVVAVVVLANRGDAAGALNVFQYLQAVYLLPYAVLAVPLATSAFPRLAEHASLGDRTAFARTAAASTRAVVVAGLLGAALLAGAAPAVASLFEHIDKGQVQAMAPALVAMSPGLLGFALIAHVGRALYALERSTVAGLATATGWLAVVVASVVAVRFVAGDRAVIGLAWGNTVGMVLAGVLLLLALGRAAGPEALAGLPRTLGVSLLAAVIAALAGHFVAVAVLDGRPGAGWAVAAGFGSAVPATLLFGAVLAALDRHDLAALLRPLRSRKAATTAGGGASDA